MVSFSKSRTSSVMADAVADLLAQPDIKASNAEFLACLPCPPIRSDVKAVVVQQVCRPFIAHAMLVI